MKIEEEINKIFMKWDPIGNITKGNLRNEYLSYARELASRITLNMVSKEEIVDYLKAITNDIVGIDPDENTKLRSAIESVTEQIWRLYQLKKPNQQEE
ncbi:MAG: hypothetical protein RLZZ358_1580 [Bacteroidota bacterium]|jgi:hypothetical protein